MPPTDGNTYSPAVEGITEPFNVGGSSGGGGGESSIYPTGWDGLADRGAQAPEMKDNESVAGVGATSGAVPFVQLATGAPESYSPDSNDPMLEGLGLPPKP